MQAVPAQIARSVLAGTGFGLVAWVCAGLAPAALLPLGLALALAGLAAGIAALGRPSRAMLMLTQWRSSWASRELLLAAAAILLALAHAAALLAGLALAPLGWLAALAGLAAVAAGGMVHASLRAVTRWHHWSVPALRTGYAVAGGALLSGQREAAAFLLALLALAQIAAWRADDARDATEAATVESATGLQGGSVRALTPLPDMVPLARGPGFEVARRHGAKLRAIALVLAAALPLALLLLPGVLALLPAALFHMAGAACQRWLFWAEARHSAAIYHRAGS